MDKVIYKNGQSREIYNVDLDGWLNLGWSENPFNDQSIGTEGQAESTPNTDEPKRRVGRPSKKNHGDLR